MENLYRVLYPSACLRHFMLLVKWYVPVCIFALFVVWYGTLSQGPNPRPWTTIQLRLYNYVPSIC